MYNLQNKSDRKDKALLQREADAINAELDWSRYRNRVDITITAPTGFIWASTKEKHLNHIVERSDPAFIREAVREILDSMQSGFEPSVADCFNEEYEEECEEEQEYSSYSIEY